jgi:hypothetical protein
VSDRTSLLRSAALALIRHARKVIPRNRSDWAEAMENEFDYIENDLSVLRWAAGCVIASYIQRGVEKMDQHMFSFSAVVKKPSAFLPLAMSFAALALLGGVYVVGLATGHGGFVRERDEGAAAHLWQLLMAGQLPVLAFFAIKWFPRAPRQTFYVLALQVMAVLAAMAPVYLLHL